MTRRDIRHISLERPRNAAERTAVRVVGFGPVDERKLRGALEVVPLGPRGVVVIPEDDYERLADAAEEREALSAYDRTRGQETVPHAIVKRLAVGESPVRVWREHRGMTIHDLARAIGKGKGFISEIENGKKTGSLATLRAMAAALRVNLDDLAT